MTAVTALGAGGAAAAAPIPHITIPAPKATGNADAVAASTTANSESDTKTDSGFTFHDLVDIANPLQHIPGISFLYQQATGQEIKPVSNIAGGLLYGGIFGGLFALATSAVGAAFDALGGNDTQLAADWRAARVPGAPNNVIASAGGKFGGVAAPGSSLSLSA